MKHVALLALLGGCASSSPATNINQGLNNPHVHEAHTVERSIEDDSYHYFERRQTGNNVVDVQILDEKVHVGSLAASELALYLDYALNIACAANGCWGNGCCEERQPVWVDSVYALHQNETKHNLLMTVVGNHFPYGFDGMREALIAAITHVISAQVEVEDNCNIVGNSTNEELSNLFKKHCGIASRLKINIPSALNAYLDVKFYIYVSEDNPPLGPQISEFHCDSTVDGTKQVIGGVLGPAFATAMHSNSTSVTTNVTCLPGIE